MQKRAGRRRLGGQQGCRDAGVGGGEGEGGVEIHWQGRYVRRRIPCMHVRHRIPRTKGRQASGPWLGTCSMTAATSKQPIRRLLFIFLKRQAHEPVFHKIRRCVGESLPCVSCRHGYLCSRNRYGSYSGQCCERVCTVNYTRWQYTVQVYFMCTCL